MSEIVCSSGANAHLEPRIIFVGLGPNDVGIVCEVCAGPHLTPGQAGPQHPLGAGFGQEHDGGNER